VFGVDFAAVRLQEHAGSPSEDRRKILEAMAIRLWDGMRNLPFTGEQIAKALARTIAMDLTIQRDQLWSGSGWNGVFAPTIPDIVKVNLGMSDGPGEAAFLPEPLCRSALRSNLRQLFRPAESAKFEDTTLLLQIVKSPENLISLGSARRTFR
jgi:hypothetical protein